MTADTDEFKPGDRATWMRVQRGGYGLDESHTSDALVSFLAEEEEDALVECFPGMPARLFDA